MAWYNASWLYRVKVTVLASQIDSSLSNYPVYVDLSDLPANFHSNVKSDGGDIRVTSADGETELPIDLVNYNHTTDTGELHFKAAGSNSISSSSNTDFYIYYGNAGASGYAEDATYGAENVWTNYLAVYHFNEDPSTTNIKDSTANDKDGVPQGSMTSGDLVDGPMGKAIAFDGDDDSIVIADSTPKDFQSQAFTSEAYIKIANSQPDAGSWGFFTSGGTGTAGSWGHGVLNRGQVQLGHYQDTSAARNNNGDTDVGDDAYHFLSFISSGSATRQLYDGVQETATQAVGTMLGGSWNVFIGSWGALSNRFLVCEIEELRFATSDLGNDYTIATKKNLTSPATFYDVGSEEENGTGANDERSAKVSGKDSSNSERSAKITGKNTLSVDLVDVVFSEASVPADDERSAKITGKDSATSEREAKVTGKDSTNSERSAKVTGKDSANDERSAKLHGIDTTTDERQAKIVGKDTADSERPAKIKGKDQATDEKSAKITGQDSSTSEREAKIVGKDTASDERSARLTGTTVQSEDRQAKVTGKDTDASERPAKVIGKETSDSERQAKLHGVDTDNSERSATVTGQQSDADERQAKLHGVDTISDERPAKITGQDSDASERSAKTRGKDTATDERTAKIHGKDSSAEEREAKITGKLATSDERQAKTRGKDTDTSERSAKVQGKQSAFSEILAKIHGKITTAFEVLARLVGKDTDQSERSSKVTGQQSTADEVSAKTHGKATDSSERPAKIHGKDTSSSERGARLVGKAIVTTPIHIGLGKGTTAPNTQQNELILPSGKSVVELKSKDNSINLESGKPLDL